MRTVAMEKQKKLGVFDFLFLHVLVTSRNPLISVQKKKGIRWLRVAWCEWYKYVVIAWR